MASDKVIRDILMHDDCINCGLCADLCPEIWENEDDKAVLREDYKSHLAELAEDIIEAEDSCPSCTIDLVYED